MIAYYLILGVPLLAVGIWLARSERYRDKALGLVSVIAGALLSLNAVLDIFWRIP